MTIGTTGTLCADATLYRTQAAVSILLSLARLALQILPNKNLSNFISSEFAQAPHRPFAQAPADHLLKLPQTLSAARL